MTKKINFLFRNVVVPMMMVFSTAYGEELHANKEVLKCTQEELMHFFPSQIVESILIKADIPKDKAESIALTLSKKEKELSKILESRSEKLTENASNIASQREAVSKIYHESLYEVFSKVMNENGVTDSHRIQQMLDELQDTRSQLFLECIRGESAKHLFSPENASRFF